MTPPSLVAASMAPSSPPSLAHWQVPHADPLAVQVMVPLPPAAHVHALLAPGVQTPPESSLQPKDATSSTRQKAEKY